MRAEATLVPGLVHPKLLLQGISRADALKVCGMTSNITSLLFTLLRSVKDAAQEKEAEEKRCRLRPWKHRAVAPLCHAVSAACWPQREASPQGVALSGFPEEFFNGQLPVDRFCASA